MPMAYRTSREHLDDLIRLAHLALARRADRDAAERAALDLGAVDLAERIEARVALSEAELPLERLRAAFGLEATEQRCLWLLLGHAVSSEVRAASGHADGLPLELLDAAVYGAPALRERFAAELGPGGRVLRHGLVELDGAGPRLGRRARIADRVVELALGVDALADDVAGFARLLPAPAGELLVPAELSRAVLAALAHHAEHGGGPIPVVCGGGGAGKRALIAGAAAELGARVLDVSCRALPADPRALVAVQREAILHRAVLVFTGADELAEGPEARARAVDAALRGYPGPVAITARRPPGAALAPSRGALVLEVPLPPEREREQLWARHLAAGAGADGSVAAEAAARYRLTGGQIERAARIARAAADAPGLPDVHRGVRAVLDDELARLASRVEWQQDWRDLVLPEESLDELRELIARVRYRRRVLDEWGFGRKLAKGLGLAALFSGPPGTGKTMAAGLVARELGLDLYAIDLSRMVSKYIGETEKQLARVFDAAEAGHAILLFDEADAMFGKRTDVKSSVDRYANLEVNYLLQRMEAFSGITILTTNFDAAIDEAFRRRLAFRIAFPLPEEDERGRLWRAVIPAPALGAGVDFEELAEKFAMSGGYIRNAALRAAFLAAADGQRIGMGHLLRAATAEYASMGKVMSHGHGGARGLG
jgi:hypothetical protein